MALNCNKDQVSVSQNRRHRDEDKMGFEVHRFQGEVDEELLCPICSGVLEDPVQVLITLIIGYQGFSRQLTSLSLF